MQEVILRIPVSEELKDATELALAKHGLSLDDYLRLVMVSVANQGLPDHWALPSPPHDFAKVQSKWLVTRYALSEEGLSSPQQHRFSSRFSAMAAVKKQLAEASESYSIKANMDNSWKLIPHDSTLPTEVLTISSLQEGSHNNDSLEPFIGKGPVVI